VQAILTLLLLASVQVQPMRVVEQPVVPSAPATETRGALVPPVRYPPTAVAAGDMPPDRGRVRERYPETTRMTRIARRLLVVTGVAAIAVGARTCAG
jgi:hypothetical protein